MNYIADEVSVSADWNVLDDIIRANGYTGKEYLTLCNIDCYSGVVVLVKIYDGAGDPPSVKGIDLTNVPFGVVNVSAKNVRIHAASATDIYVDVRDGRV